ncbi:MAG TPA: 6-carboxytetrahydropterin synthase [Bacteroidales bacterium]|nr:6-carboxytetrahydropterin synthase [Bacteroidales bacterium]HSA42154.1 6-carboxytetrahydropterin synthase [Bacteroidales bacterium]
MNTVRITKEFGFEMAHALSGHDGPCRFIHGHSYVLRITIAGKPSVDQHDPKLGMVMDFSDLKKIVKDQIIDQFDHALVLHAAARDSIPTTAADAFSRVIWLPYQPTSENLLIDFTARIISSLPAGVRLVSARLRETATSYAEWLAEDNR